MNGKLGSTTIINNKATRPDRQRWDRVEMSTAVRWKESELSGDEYRISAVTRLFYKDHMVREFQFSDVDDAIRYLDGSIIFNHADWDFIDDSYLCDQEGFSKVASVKYKRLNAWTSRGDKETLYDWNLYRVFCDQHKTRGDCALDDADRNYEQVDFTPEEQQSLDMVRVQS